MVTIQNNRQSNLGITTDMSWFSNTDGWIVVHVDACNYGRTGLQTALEYFSFIGDRNFVISVSSLEEALHETHPYVFSGRIMRCLVVRLPSMTREALIMLLQLSEMTQDDIVLYHQVVVLSPFDTVTVRRLVAIMGMTNVRVVDSRLSPLALCNTVHFGSKERMAKGRYLGQVLTSIERNALRQSLLFWPVQVQAELRSVSIKTIYNQRDKALRKFGAHNMRTLLHLLSPKMTGGSENEDEQAEAKNLPA
ncbi:hypothetical protein [Enterobacter cloacae]|uniref:hypothetical protein n=1 Tax=Enterobacter cloacae TaxID=550 RepID=UPI002B215AF6|nr:hypothetical protein [Enterobacter cloacae]MEA5217530.1 hypothetical protein [Enterobacter cloacae]